MDLIQSFKKQPKKFMVFEYTIKVFSDVTEKTAEKMADIFGGATDYKDYVLTSCEDEKILENSKNVLKNYEYEFVKENNSFYNISLIFPTTDEINNKILISKDGINIFDFINDVEREFRTYWEVETKRNLYTGFYKLFEDKGKLKKNEIVKDRNIFLNFEIKNIEKLYEKLLYIGYKFIKDFKQESLGIQINEKLILMF